MDLGIGSDFFVVRKLRFLSAGARRGGTLRQASGPLPGGVAVAQKVEGQQGEGVAVLGLRRVRE